MLLAQRPLVEFTLKPLTEEHGLPLAIMGILVVFSALVLVLVFITLLPRILGRVSTPDLQPAPVVPSVFDEQPSQEIVAVIAAAVAVTIDKPHRIVKIRGLTPGEIGWSMEGRMQHHQSHRISNRTR